MTRRQGRNLLLVAALLGIALWYAGAGKAAAATLDGVPLVPVIVLALAGAGGGVAWSRRDGASTQGGSPIAGALAGAMSAGLFSYGLVAGLNVWLDRSSRPEAVDAVVTDVRTPSKGPPVLVVRTESGERTFPRELAQGCRAGVHAILSVRPGALGSRWVQSASCSARAR